MASAGAPTATFVYLDRHRPSTSLNTRPSAVDHRPTEYNVSRFQTLRSSILDATVDATAELCTKPIERYSFDLAHAHDLSTLSINIRKRALNRQNDEHNRYPNQAPQ
jgi:hypothetical protein